jgi:polar amino acid transport system substrate-binding protein
MKSLLASLVFICFTLNPIAVKAQLPEASQKVTEESQSPDSSKLRVGVAGEPPGVIIKGDQPDPAVTGMILEAWHELATELDLDYELVYHHSVHQALETLAAQKIDLAIGNISITDERISRFDFTQPISQAHLTILVPSESPTLWSVIKPFLGWVFLSSIGFIFLCLFIVGNLLWLAEHRENSQQFPKSYLKGVSEGMWCALATFTTVGYGDRYPITYAGRLISGMWMIISLAAVTSLTAGVATTLAVAFSAQPYQKLQDTSDLQGVRLAAILDSTAVQWAKYYQARVTPVEDLSDAISLLESNQVDGVIYTKLTLEHYLQENPQAPYQLVKFNIGTQNYGIALSLNSPLTRKLNQKILSIDMQIRLQEILETWYKLNLDN